MSRCSFNLLYTCRCHRPCSNTICAVCATHTLIFLSLFLVLGSVRIHQLNHRKTDSSGVREVQCLTFLSNSNCLSLFKKKTSSYFCIVLLTQTKWTVTVQLTKSIYPFAFLLSLFFTRLYFVDCVSQMCMWQWDQKWKCCVMVLQMESRWSGDRLGLWSCPALCSISTAPGWRTEASTPATASVDETTSFR